MRSRLQNLSPLQISIAGIIGTIFGRKKNNHNELVKRLYEFGHSNEQIVNEILALLVGTTVEISLGRCERLLLPIGVLTSQCVALTNVVNLILDSEEHATFRTQAQSVDAKDITGLEAYVIEALSKRNLSCKE